jgi:hypothetical protein
MAEINLTIADLERIESVTTHDSDTGLIVRRLCKAVRERDAEIERLKTLLAEVRDESFAECDNPQLSYVTVQLTRSMWEQLQSFEP